MKPPIQQPHGVQQARAITFTTVHGGKISRQTEFWPENYPAPDNRQHLVVRDA